MRYHAEINNPKNVPHAYPWRAFFHGETVIETREFTEGISPAELEKQYKKLLRWRNITKRCVYHGLAKLQLFFKACEEVRAFEMRYNPNHDDSLEKRGNGGGNPNHDEEGKFCSGNDVGLTSKAKSVRMGKKERAFITSQISTYYYNRYAGEKEGTYYSAKYDKTYVFDIFGFDDYVFTDTLNLTESKE